MSVRPSQKFRDKMALRGWTPTSATPPAWTAADEMKSPRFLAACKAEGVEPTKRQASAFLARRGRWGRYFDNRVVKPVPA